MDKPDKKWVEELKMGLLLDREPLEVIFSGGVADTIRVLPFNRLILMINKLRQEAWEEGRQSVVKEITSDISEVNFDKGWREKWEVLPNIGVEPCPECNNGYKIRKYLASLKEGGKE